MTANAFMGVPPFGKNTLSRINKTSAELANWVNILTLSDAVSLYYGIKSLGIGQTGIVQNNNHTVNGPGYSPADSPQPESLFDAASPVNFSQTIDMGSFGVDQAFYRSSVNYASLPKEIYDTDLQSVVGYTVPGPFANIIPFAFGGNNDGDEVGNAPRLIALGQRTESVNLHNPPAHLPPLSSQFFTCANVYAIYTGNTQTSGVWEAVSGSAKEVWTAQYFTQSLFGVSLNALSWKFYGYEPPIAPAFSVTEKKYGISINFPDYEETITTTTSPIWPSDNVPTLNLTPWKFDILPRI